MKMSRVDFKNQESFEAWINTMTEDEISIDNTVTVINDGEWIKCDLTTSAKSFLTAINRLFAVFSEEEVKHFNNLDEWKSMIIESVKSRYFYGGGYANVMHHSDNYDNDSYSWEIEWVNEDTIYFFFNLNYKFHNDYAEKSSVISEIMHKDYILNGKNILQYHDLFEKSIEELKEIKNNQETVKFSDFLKKYDDNTYFYIFDYETRKLIDSHYNFMMDEFKNVESYEVKEITPVPSSSDIRIYIKKLECQEQTEEEIISIRIWYSEDLFHMCIKENFYTNGTNDEYSEILSYVNQNKPTYKNIRIVAENIANHSKYMNNDEGYESFIRNIMYIIFNDVIKTCFIDSSEISRYENRENYLIVKG